MNLLFDVGLAFRMFRRNAGITALIVLTLALGIGATTTIFSFVNGVLLESLPYPAADRLVSVATRFVSVTPGDFLDWQQQNHVFEEMAAFNFGTANLTSGGEPVQLFAAFVSPRFAETASVEPRLGRTFAVLPPGDVARSVTISSRLWQSRFRGDPSIVGKGLVLDGVSYMVVGVMPNGFSFPLDVAYAPRGALPDVDLWIPASLRPGYRSNATMQVVARLRPNVSVAQASDEINALERRIGARAAEPGSSISIVPLKEQVVRRVRPLLTMLFGAVAILLAIACGNATNLLLARATGREREVAIRAALGAGRGRLIQQFLVESVMLALLGGTAGLLVAVWGLDAARTLVPKGTLPRLETVSIDGRVLAFATCVSILAGLLFGLMPALRSGRRDIVGSLKATGTTHTPRSRPIRTLVTAQVALAFVLLSGAALLALSFHRLTSVLPGFAAENVLTVDVALPQVRYPALPELRTFSSSVLDRLRQTHGVTDAAAVNLLPIGGPMLMGDFTADGAAVTDVVAVKVAVSPGYFHTMGIPLFRGRDFNDDDSENGPGAVIVTESLARRLWPGRDAIGRRIKLGFGAPDQEPWRTVAGVVGDVKQTSLQDATRPAIYMPLRQAPLPFLIRSLTFVVRTTDDPRRVMPAVRAGFRNVDPTLPLGRMSTMTALLADSVSEPRFRTILLGSFAGAALALISVGILGVLLSYVAQRTREISLRMALGADVRDVLELVVSQSLGMTTAGLAIGIALAIPLSRLLRAYLFDIQPNDPLAFVAAAALLLAFVLAASYVPARRAAHVDPLVALRAE